MTRLEDIQNAARLGVDAIGLIFYSKSPRCVSKEQAQIILENLPPFIDVVGVFVDPDSTFVREMIENVPLQYLQFHGEEPQDFCAQFSLPFIKAVPASSQEIILNTAQRYDRAAAILLDTPSETVHGGSGKSFSWEMIPKAAPRPLILAGGINSSNIGVALKKQMIYGVDVCSGVEASPGIKDFNKMKTLVKACYCDNRV